MTLTRRNFIKTTGAGLIAAGAPVLASGSFSHPVPEAKYPFRLAIAGYTFAKFNLDQTLEMMKRVNIGLLGVKDFHLPLDSSQEVINQTLEKMKSFGVEPYGVGPIYMKSEEAIDQAFAYAGRVGTNTLVGVPDVHLLPYVEKKVREYNIRLAIHNHGPDLPIYPGAIDVWKEIRDLDPGWASALDIAHSVRLGQDPFRDFLNYKERIFDFHIWDVDKAEKSGWCVESGRGLIDFPRFFRMLKEHNYTGTCSLEYAKDMDDPLAGIAESIGYFRGVLAGLA